MAKAENGGLDPLQVKAVFYALCFGDDAPTRRAAANFVECFYRLEERTETTTDVLEDGTVVVPDYRLLCGSAVAAGNGV